ncbi:transporter substrate-binding domain-containing protein [Maledivibacter halophilus]|uniref:histidine kinase n=1 Tax=Maledivibacter halophilus TaxID=36842 RepID=A0A1T5MM23_9FIRM|nr:transporter substrate-binding domain-containing protein [Maledivibacter halophilus]SKC89280.1 polar amino acid transport system substrate-binding protein [Maledivibacter halophilus]
MIKKLLFLISIVLVILFANSFTKLEYDMNLIDYLSSDTTLSKDEITYLNDHNTLIYGADYNSPPLRYVNEGSQQYEGLVIDYLRALSIELGIAIEFKPLIWNDALDLLSNGETDLCDMYKSEERSKKFLFSNPIYYQRGAILVRKSDNLITTVEDLEGKTIAGSKVDYIFEHIDKEFDNVTGIETSDLQEAIKLLTDERIDAVLGDESVMNYFITKAQLKNEYSILDDYLYEREAVLGVHKDNSKLLKILNKAIRNLKKKKTMELIYQKWFGISPLITKNNRSRKITLITKYIFSLIFVLGTALYSWNIQLKKEVKRQTNELRLSNNELETVFNGLTHLMTVIDDECYVKDANKTFCEKYNLTADMLKNAHCKDINGILGSICETCPIKETFNENRTVIKEIKHKNRIYKVSTYILDQLPQMKKRILVVMEDITDFKLTEQSMLQSTKMAAVGQLAAGIAHEMRTPLGIIRNNCYFMKRSKSQDDKDESMAVIESSVDRANRIIDNLLNFSRMTDNKVSQTNIYNLISNIYDLSKKLFENHKISFGLQCPKDLVFTINSESLKHVMINLINNAIDAMGEGGDLDIHVMADSKEMIIQVSDTGKGIDEDILKNIFNPFFTTKEPGSGTGLGLYITYNEVQKMKGVIDVDSILGVGTTFALIIPRHDKLPLKEVE